MSGPVQVKAPAGQFPILWEKENYTASIDGVDEDGDGCDFTMNAPEALDALFHDDGISKGYVRIFGQTKFTDTIRFAPFACRKKNLKQAGPSSDAFNEVFALHTLSSLFDYFSGIGLNIGDFIRDQGYGKTAFLKVNTGSEEICNAWYSPSNGDLTFGKCDKMHTAADGDIVTHEFGHWLLDKLNPKLLEPSIVISDNWWPVPHKLYAGEQDAIHEGFADALAAIVNGNPIISEDSWVFTGKEQGEGLRNVNNDVKRKGLPPEPHERGKVYGGFFWSMYGSIKKMIEKRSTGENPATVSIMLMWEHALHYRVAHPNTEQFVDAMLASANALFNAEVISINPFELRDAILDEALKRELIDKKYHAERKTEEKTDIPESFMLQKKSDIEFRSAECVKMKLSNDKKASFQPAVRTWTAAGTHDFHQQIYTTASGAKVQVLGAGFTVEVVRPKGRRFKRGGEFRHVFTDGVRDLSRAGAVDETVKFTGKAALLRLANEARRLERKVAAQLAAQKKRPLKDDAARMKLGSIYRDRVALTSAREILAASTGDDASLVLLPGYSSLSWRFSAGDVAGYVDAKTGKVTIVKNYIVD